MKITHLLIYVCIILMMSCVDHAGQVDTEEYYYLKNADRTVATKVEPELINPIYQDLIRLNRIEDAKNLLRSYDKTTGSIIGFNIKNTNSITTNESGRTSTVIGAFDYGYHMQSYGWIYGNDVVADEAPAYYDVGTAGLSKRMEAFLLKLEGINLCYEAYQQDYAWEGSECNGNISGITGQSKRIEAVRVWIADGLGYTSYKSYIQDSGWETTWKQQGQISGTTGQSKRLEAFRLMFYIY